MLLVASTAFTLWARVALGRMWSATPNMLRAGHQLRTDGPYGITRHPIYTGLFGMILGTVLLNGFGPALVALVVGAAVFGTRIPIEERLIEQDVPRGVRPLSGARAPVRAGTQPAPPVALSGSPPVAS